MKESLAQQPAQRPWPSPSGARHDGHKGGSATSSAKRSMERTVRPVRASVDVTAFAGVASTAERLASNRRAWNRRSVPHFIDDKKLLDLECSPTRSLSGGVMRNGRP